MVILANKGSYSACILKADLMRFVDLLDRGYEREELVMMSEFLAQAPEDGFCHLLRGERV